MTFLTAYEPFGGLDNNYIHLKPENICYQKKPENTVDLSENFLITRFHNNNNINDCKELAEEQNRDYFLVSDASYNSTGTLTKFSYNCYIPIKGKECLAGTFEDLVKPINDLLDGLFSPINESTFQHKTISGDIILNLKSDNTKCFKYIFNAGGSEASDDMSRNFFGNSGHFVLYKNDLIETTEIRELEESLGNVKPYSDYNDIYKEEFINGDPHETILKGLKSNFIQYLQADNENKNNHKVNYENKLVLLQNYYSNRFNNLDDIAQDISTISYVSKHYTYYLEDMQRKINNEQIILRNVLGLDGGNNGKLIDTKYLKNLKISEISILSILIVFVIFIYSKKK